MQSLQSDLLTGIEEMDATVEALWLLHTAVHGHYNISRATNAAVRPELSVSSPVLPRPYTQADLTHFRTNCQLPQPAVLGSSAARAPRPVPLLRGAVHAPAAQTLYTESQPAQVNATDFLYSLDLRTVNRGLPILEVSDAEQEDQEKREATKKRNNCKFEKAGLCYPGKQGSILN